VERVTAFYRDLLGCRVEKVQADLGLIQLRAGDSLIDLVDLAGPLGEKGGAGPGAEGRNLDHLCLRLLPFDRKAILAWLEDAGLEPGDWAERYGADGRGPSVYIADPEGNIVELKGPPGA
jgi:catechol 2,3-dioxygenase-like lactoylglutathione lyase family enzyme